MNRFELEQFIIQNGREIYSFCLWLTQNKQESDDLFQDVFVKILEKQSLPSEPVDLKKIFLSLCVRIWKEKKRKFARRKRIAEENCLTPLTDMPEAEKTYEKPEEFVLKKEEYMFVREYVRSLPDKKRLIVVLFYTEGLRIEDIAAVMKIPTGTVKNILFRVKKDLASKLSDYNTGKVPVQETERKG